MSDTFQSSDLSVPSSQTEHWRALAYNMPPSTAPGVPIAQAKDTSQDAQWLRKLSFTVYSGSGGDKSQGLELSDLRVNFHVKHQQVDTPAILWARVYNMAPATMAKVIAFTRVQLKAGYRFSGGPGLIFDGTVVQYRRGKENPTDTYLEFHAADGDTRMNRNLFVKQFPAGTDDEKKLNEAVKALGIPIKHIDKFEWQTTQRDQTIAEPAKQAIRDLMKKYNGTFHIQHGQLVLMKSGNSLPGEAVVLTPRTGLVSLPEVTPQGIEATCLLNPKIVVGGKVKISTEVLSGIPFTPGSAIKDQGKGSSTAASAGGAAGQINPTAMWGGQLETAFTSPTGTYKVVLLEHTGDTRGNPWYCKMTCVALDDQGKVLDVANPSGAFARLASPEAARGSR